MWRSAPPFLLALLLTLTVAGCGDGSDAASGEQASVTADTTSAGGSNAGEREPRAAEPRVKIPQLPDAKPLTDDDAQSVLHSILGSVSPDGASRETLLYLAELGDDDAVGTAIDALLAKSGGAYVDPYAAALGLELALAADRDGAAAEAIALVRLARAEEDETSTMVHALRRIEGAEQADAEALLAELTQSFDDEIAMLALQTLAERRSPVAADLVATTAADAEKSDLVRASAVAAMLATRDARASAAADALVAGESTGWDIIDGFAIHGAVDTVPYIQRIVDQAFEDGNADFEFAAACYALAEIYRDGPGSDAGRALIEAWLEADPELDGDAATYALWTMGDNSRTADAAALLAIEVAGATNSDGEMAVSLLDVVAQRGLARDPRFKNAVDAAAAMPDREGLPGLDLTSQGLRSAAAHAYLRSR